jgi:hypothetical protein
VSGLVILVLLVVVVVVATSRALAVVIAVLTSTSIQSLEYVSHMLTTTVIVLYTSTSI